MDNHYTSHISYLILSQTNLFKDFCSFLQSLEMKAAKESNNIYHYQSGSSTFEERNNQQSCPNHVKKKKLQPQSKHLQDFRLISQNLIINHIPVEASLIFIIVIMTSVKNQQKNVSAFQDIYLSMRKKDIVTSLLIQQYIA